MSGSIGLARLAHGEARARALGREARNVRTPLKRPSGMPPLQVMTLAGRELGDRPPNSNVGFGAAEQALDLRRACALVRADAVDEPSHCA